MHAYTRCNLGANISKYCSAALVFSDKIPLFRRVTRKELADTLHCTIFFFCSGATDPNSSMISEKTDVNQGKKTRGAHERFRRVACERSDKNSRPQLSISARRYLLHPSFVSGPACKEYLLLGYVHYAFCASDRIIRSRQTVSCRSSTNRRLLSSSNDTIIRSFGITWLRAGSTCERPSNPGRRNFHAHVNHVPRVVIQGRKKSIT